MSVNRHCKFTRQKCDQEAEKILKYKDLTTEIWCTCSVKTKVITVIRRATRTISRSFRKYLRNIPGKHRSKELQKTAILGTAHINHMAYINKDFFHHHCT
jgi:hypothetical protein